MKKILLLGIGVLLLSSELFAQGEELVWGGAGDPNSEFAGGLNDWTTVGITDEDAVWVWEANGAADMGAYSGGSGGINSPSLSNGAMVFDSDFYDNGGVAGAFGEGIAPAPATGELISPIMDLSGVGKLTLKFNEYHRNFLSENQVAYSTDGGVTWSEPIVTNSDVPINEANLNTTVQEIPLYGALGSDQFRIKFIMNGNYYFWVIDDVQLYSRYSNDMQVNTNFFAIAPNYQTPVSQVETFGFLADIRNRGASDQTNVELDIAIEDPSGAEIYTATNEYGTIVSDSLAENSSFGDFETPAITGTYTGTYTVSSDSIDSNLSNNVIEFEFQVSDTVFAKDAGVDGSIFPGSANWSGGDPHQWAFGNYYRIVNGEGYYANTATFSIASDETTEDTDLDIRLYSWNDENEDNAAQPDERVLVGFAIYAITGNEGVMGNSAYRTVPLLGLDLQTPELTNDTDYLLMMEYRAADDVSDLRMGASSLLDYGAMTLNSIQQERPRYESFLGISGNLDNEDYTPGGFIGPDVAVARLNVTEAPLISSQEDIRLPENTVTINPNPATDVLNTALSFAENAQKVSIRMMDVQGRVVLTRNLENVSNTNQIFDISKLAAGTYFMHVTTENGRIAKKVIVK